jgi:predicted metalloendopeptidase
MFNTKLRHIYYNFNRKILLGQPEMQTNEMFSLVGMSYCFNYFLSQEYIKHFYNPQTINYVKGLFGDLIIVFKRIISNNTWLSNTGKKNALLKLNIPYDDLPMEFQELIKGTGIYLNENTDQ